jgi:hypothetical protein
MKTAYDRVGWRFVDVSTVFGKDIPFDQTTNLDPYGQIPRGGPGLRDELDVRAAADGAGHPPQRGRLRGLCVGVLDGFEVRSQEARYRKGPQLMSGPGVRSTVRVTLTSSTCRTRRSSASRSASSASSASRAASRARASSALPFRVRWIA